MKGWGAELIDKLQFLLLRFYFNSRMSKHSIQIRGDIVFGFLEEYLMLLEMEKQGVAFFRSVARKDYKARR